MSQENTDGKKSIGICLSVISCVLLYFLLFKSPSQCSALSMHTCGATMIHIIATCGDDSNQKLKCTPANNLKRPDSQRRDLHKVQLWKSRQDYAVLLTVLTRNVCITTVSPLDKTHTAARAQTWREIRFKSTNTLNIKTQTTKCAREKTQEKAVIWPH